MRYAVWCFTRCPLWMELSTTFSYMMLPLRVACCGVAHAWRRARDLALHNRLGVAHKLKAVLKPDGRRTFFSSSLGGEVHFAGRTGTGNTMQNLSEYIKHRKING